MAGKTGMTQADYKTEWRSGGSGAQSRRARYVREGRYTVDTRTGEARRTRAAIPPR